MIARVAWRILTHEKGRSALAMAGIFVAVLLVFVELGFFIAVPQGGMLIYSRMRFDLLLASSAYVYQAQSGAFPHVRLYQASAVPEVSRAAPVYFGSASWLNAEAHRRLDIFLIGFDPHDRIFAVDDVEQQSAMLEQPDTVLVDSATRATFGPLTAGRSVEIAGRAMTIGGTYALGTGFLGLGVALASDRNFFRLFPQRDSDSVNLGLVELNPGTDPGQAAQRLRTLLPSDTQVFTRDELQRREVSYWTTRTSTGLIFGSGLLVSFIVGTMVLYQTLSTQITRQLPQFATLKAIGYTDRALAGIVILLGLLLVVVAFIPALGAALGLYAVIREQTLLPVDMTPLRLAAVLAITLVMAAASAFLSLGGLRRADPADVF
ncbi:MAG: FtsX-like permease family protein [Alphaproteobacteria bacterium]|nr:FtsX-like permease family protein [Alphaproteobacteria bacterium]